MDTMVVMEEDQEEGVRDSPHQQEVHQHPYYPKDRLHTDRREAYLPERLPKQILAALLLLLPVLQLAKANLEEEPPKKLPQRDYRLLRQQVPKKEAETNPSLALDHCRQTDYY